ncbi:hypothetical protein NDU88_000801 [Pleurodeles waltl]|uniref:Uncharacterized protein n=1 Tax=Pleurodeles waltl TaxID=8319 RepID=A0AAV7LB94_PLEWA|nr:hypothetical protein NDU88_000801 [Pleurodeles waltl]
MRRPPTWCNRPLGRALSRVRRWPHLYLFQAAARTQLIRGRRRHQSLRVSPQSGGGAHLRRCQRTEAEEVVSSLVAQQRYRSFAGNSQEQPLNDRFNKNRNKANR